MADDQNVGSVGCYGNPEVLTPNMDKLGTDGVIFRRHYNTTAICMASRATVFTGMYEYKTGTNFSHGDMKPEVWAKSYPVLLREAGYLTAFAGKFGMKVEGKGLCESDFDMWGGAPGQSSYVTQKNKSMAKYADKYPHATLSYGAFGRDVVRAAVKQNKPFCLSISFKAPHRPVTPDPSFDHVYAGKTFTRPANFGRAAGEHMSPQSKQGRQYGRFTEWRYDTDYDGVMAKYYQLIYAIDVALGMIRDELEAQGVADNTVIIYTSDNGYICGAHGYGSKVLPMEESSRAPLMIYDPRSPSAGKQWHCSALTGNIDFAPTILELAGLPLPKSMDGHSLLPLLKNPALDVREQMSFINVWGPAATTSLTCLTKEWKYTYWWYSNETMKPTEELFHLAKDPLEMTNLAGNPQAAGMLKSMRNRYDAGLEKWRRQAVAYNDYAKYGDLFKRKEVNAAKASRPAKKRRAKYLETGGERKLNVLYKTVQQRKLHLDLYYPTENASGKYPVVIYTHGGGWAAGSRLKSENSSFGRVFMKLVEKGFCVVPVSYRLYRKGGDVAMRDCVIDSKDAIRYLSRNSESLKIDPMRMYVFGDSAGGQIAQMLLLSSPESLPGDASPAGASYKMVAGVSWYGPCDFEKTDLFNHDDRENFRDRFGPRILKPGTKPEDKPALYREMSPINYLTKDSPPLLMIQGDKDTTIPVKHAYYMQEKAEKLNAPVQILIVKNSGHNWRSVGADIAPTREEIIERTVQFFVDHL